MDSDGWSSSSAEELAVDLNSSELPPQMLKPVADWDLPSLLTALTATPLKAKLHTMGTGTSALCMHRSTMPELTCGTVQADGRSRK